MQIKNQLTNGDVGAAVCFKETIDELPNLRQPLDDVEHLWQLCVVANLGFEQTSAQVACEKAVNRFHVIGTENPAEVMVKLKIGRWSARLVHHSNDVRAASNAQLNNH